MRVALRHLLLLFLCVPLPLAGAFTVQRAQNLSANYVRDHSPLSPKLRLGNGNLSAIVELLNRGESLSLRSPDGWNYTIVEDPQQIARARGGASKRPKIPLKQRIRGIDGENVLRPRDSDRSGDGSDSSSEGSSGADGSEEYVYSDSYARYRILGICAAAYAPDPGPCLANTFEKIELYRNVSIECDVDGTICAAFVAIHHDSRSIIVAFRGTNTFVQLVMEVHTSTFRPLVDSPIGGKVGSYFMNIFNLLWTNTTLGADVDALHAKHPDYDIHFAGHSLGGALAALGAARVVSEPSYDPSQIQVTTLGQPRTGDKDFSLAYDTKLQNSTYRIVNHRDVVAHVPPLRFRNYTHHTAEVWYPGDMSVVDDSDADDDNADAYTLCLDDPESEDCSDQLAFFSVYDHVYYFGERVGTLFYDDCLVDDD